MPITPFLRNHAFDPEQLEVMSGAFLDACSKLGLTDRTDAATALVAGRIIDLAQRGILTRPELFQGAVDGFMPYEA